MCKLGTILPTRKSINLTQAWARENAIKRDRVARIELSQYRHEFVQGENRYYDGDKFYAVVGLNDFQVKWFEIRADGDYAVQR